MSLLEHNSRKMWQIDKTIFKLKFENIDNKINSGGKEYKVEAICNSKIYDKKSDSDLLVVFYDLILWKSCPDKENI